METKHTPGPWISTTTGSILVDKPGEQLDRAIATTCELRKEQHANARLIAAAPELIENSQRNVEIMIELRDKHLSHTATVIRSLLQKRIEATCAAIAKAKGE